MNMLRFTDALTIDGSVSVTDRGLVALAKAARTGIQDYLGSEMGRPDLPIVRVYRPADEVFHADALASFSHAPITMDHPAEPVTPDNIKQYEVGEVSTAAKVENGWVSLPLIVKHRDAIDAVQSGKNQLSAGYSCQIDWTPGTTENGEAYDAIQRNIRINHLAIVDAARAGPDARIGDAKVWGASPIQTGDAPITQTDKGVTMSMVNIVLGDKVVAVAATDAPAVEAFKADAAKKLEDAQAAHDAAIAAKDAELAAKDAEIDGLKAKVLDGAALDAAVAARGDLIAKAKAICSDVKTDGLNDADIRKAVVIAKRGDSVKDKSQAYFDAAFDILAEDASTVDPVRFTIASDAPVIQNDAHAAYLARMTGKKGS